MDSNRKELESVKALLQSSPKGMTITDVSEKLHVSRNSVAKYLEMLLIAGEVEMKTFGRSKIYLLSSKVPLATVLSLSSELIAFVDEDLRVIDVNRQFLQFGEVEREQVVGHTLEEISLGLLNHRDVLLNIRDALRGREFVREITIARRGEEFYFKAKLIPVTAGSARPRIAVIYENITARKKAELALKESEARYRAVVEDQTDMICRMLPDTTITFVNDAWCKFFRVSRESVLGQKHVDLIPGPYQSDFLRDIDSIKPQVQSTAAEHYFEMPDGRAFWMLFAFRGIFSDKGRLAEVQIVVRDVTGRKQAELALKESEARYRAVVEDQTEVVCRMLPDTTITFVNEACYRFWGVGKSDITGKKLMDFIAPGDRTMIKSMLRDIRHEADTGSYEDCHTRPDGTVQWMLWIWRGIFDEHHRLAEYQLVARDVTGRKLAELALKESERKYRTLFNNSSDMVLLVRPKTKDRPEAIIDVNDVVCRTLGYTRDELLSLGISAIAAPECMDTLSRVNRELDECDQATYTMECLTKSGKRVPGEVRTHRFELMGVTVSLSVVRDITERLLAEEQVRKLSRAVENSPASVVITDLKGGIDYVNPKFTQITGYTFEEVRGKNPNILKTGHTTQEEYKQLWDKVLAGEEWRGEFLNKRKDGGLYWESALIAPIKDAGGRIVSLLGIKEDITLRKKSEEALKFTQFALDHFVDPVIWLSSDGGLAYANEAAAATFGYPRDALLSMHVWDIDPNFPREHFLEFWTDLKLHHNFITFETRPVASDGRIFPVEITSCYTSHGDKEFQIAFLRDITERKRAEALLRDSEARYRAVVEDQTDLIVRMLPDTTITFVNEVCDYYWGIRPEQIIGKRLVDFTPDVHRTIVKASLDSLRAGDAPGHSENVTKLRDGTERWLHWTYRGTFDEQGQPREYQIVARDITERKLAEQALQASEENFRTIYDRSPIGIGTVSVDLRFVSANPELCRITGYAEDELLSMMVSDITYPDDRASDLEILNRMIDLKIDHDQHEKRYLCKDGSIIWVRVSWRLIIDTAGTPRYIVGMVEDVTERKQLIESLRLTQFSVDHAVDEVNWVSPDGRLIYVNEASVCKLGYTKEALLSMHVWDIDPVYTRERHAALMETIRAEGQTTFLSVHRTRDGAEFPVEITAIWLPTAGQDSICAYVRDVSERKLRGP